MADISTVQPAETSIPKIVFALRQHAERIMALAPLASPTFTGDPQAPTPSPGDNDTSIATTAFVTAAIAAATGKFLGVQVFTSGGTYTRTAGCTIAIAEVWGGGGAGGGIVATNSPANSIGAGAGGGAGGYAAKKVSPGATETVTIGAGGTAGTGGGGNGGTTSFGAFVSATGGSGGATTGSISTASQAAGGSGGSGSGGNINTTGGTGGSAVVFSDATKPFYVTGIGAASARGASVNPTSSASQAGTTGIQPGGGGSGAQAFNTASTFNGGTGGAGMCVVWEFT